jgi:hypothetical protein
METIGDNGDNFWRHLETFGDMETNGDNRGQFLETFGDNFSGLLERYPNP